MKYLYISTPYGDQYWVDEQGRISLDKKHFSTDWKMSGVIRVNCTQLHWTIPLCELFKQDLSTFQWRYKNGNPRYTVVDLDHGTTRVWGNTKRHGIRSISRVETNP